MSKTVKIETVKLYDFLQLALESEIEEEYGKYSKELEIKYIEETGRDFRTLLMEYEKGKSFKFLDKPRYRCLGVACNE